MIKSHVLSLFDISTLILKLLRTLDNVFFYVKKTFQLHADLSFPGETKAWEGKAFPTRTAKICLNMVNNMILTLYIISFFSYQANT